MADDPSSSQRNADFDDFSRLILHLPIYKSREKLAAQAIINKFRCKYGGSTYTDLDRSPFVGAWLDDSVSPPDLFEGAIALLIIDMPFGMQMHKQEVGREVDTIRRYALTVYRRFVVPQISIWIVIVPIFLRLPLRAN